MKIPVLASSSDSQVRTPNEKDYRILSFKRPGRLYIIFDFGVGVYWRGAFIQKT